MAEPDTGALSKIKKRLFSTDDWNRMQECDMFDISDENVDALEYTTEELNQFYLSGHLRPILIDEEPVMDVDVANEQTRHRDTTLLHDSEEQEGQLSQSLSQLSVTEQENAASTDTKQKRERSSSISSPSVTIKKQKTENKKADKNDIHDDGDKDDNEDPEFDLLPYYLSSYYRPFVQMTQSILKISKSITFNDIQKLAFLMHQKANAYLKRELIKVYLLSVLGQLQGTESVCELVEMDRRVWPIQVKSFMLTHYKSMSSDTATTTVPTMERFKDNISEKDQSTCEKLLHEKLQDMKELIEHYEREIHEKKTSLADELTVDHEKIIQNFIDRYGMKALKMKYHFKSTMVRHNYDWEILERKYRQEQPNEYQIQTMTNLLHCKREFERSKRELLELKQRVFYNKPSTKYHFLPLTSSISISTSTSTSNDSKPKPYILNQDELQRVHHNLDTMIHRLRQFEFDYYLHKTVFEEALSEMWKNHRNLVKDRGMTSALLNLLERRLEVIESRWRNIFNYRMDYFLKNAYDDLLEINFSNETKHPNPNQYLSNILMTCQHSLTTKQLQLLNRGPTYVPPCQMYVSSSYESFNDILRKQYAPLKHQLTSLFGRFHINIALSMEIQKKAFDQFKAQFALSIPMCVQERALYEKQLIETIRSSLTKNHLLLRRTADQMNTFVVLNRQHYDQLSNRYVARCEAYKPLIDKSNETTHEQHIQSELKELIDSMNILLESLQRHKSLDKDTIKRLFVDINKIKLPHLYFLPDLSQNNDLVLVPLVACQDSATWKIGKFIHQLLRPLVDNVLQSTTFYDEIDFIEKLNHYAYKRGRLRPTTLFCSIKITTYNALDSHSSMIDSVGYFLSENLASNKLENVTILTIKNLLHLYLYYNVFYHNGEIYTFTQGCPNTMELSETLSDIYIYMWQKHLLKEINHKEELFGRYKDEIFFTWNKSDALELEKFIQDIRETYRNVRHERTIGQTVQYLNMHVENRNGQLHSRIHHSPSIQRYRLPYVVGHSKLAYSEWFRLALIQAVCGCSCINDFHDERLYLELTCLVNGYSLMFVETHVQHFFNYFQVPGMRYTANQALYEKFREQWFDYMHMQHDLTRELVKFNHRNHVLHVDYIYEYGPRCRFNRCFKELWSNYFSQHPSLSSGNNKLLLTTKHYNSLNSLLAYEQSTYNYQRKT